MHGARSGIRRLRFILTRHWHRRWHFLVGVKRRRLRSTRCRKSNRTLNRMPYRRLFRRSTLNRCGPCLRRTSMACARPGWTFPMCRLLPTERRIKNLWQEPYRSPLGRLQPYTPVRFGAIERPLSSKTVVRTQPIRTWYARPSFDYCTLSQRTSSSRESVEVVHLCFFQGLRSRSAAVSRFPPGLALGHVRVARAIFTRSPRPRLQPQ